MVAERGSVAGRSGGLHRVAMKATRLQTAALLAVAKNIFIATHVLPAARVLTGHMTSLYFDAGFCNLHELCTFQPLNGSCT